jgi:hypothetical protein
MAIFRALDDNPRLVALGLSDADLIRYVVNRSNKMPEQEALRALVHGKNCTPADTEFIRQIVEQFPIA